MYKSNCLMSYCDLSPQLVFFISLRICAHATVHVQAITNPASSAFKNVWGLLLWLLVVEHHKSSLPTKTGVMGQLWHKSQFPCRIMLQYLAHVECNSPQ